MKISKYIEYAYTKLKVCYKERKYYKNGYELKYILENQEFVPFSLKEDV